MNAQSDRPSLEEVQEYWSEHLNLTQFLKGEKVELEIGSPEFFAALRRSVDRFAYKRELLDRMWRERVGERLIEIGCGLGIDLVELARRGFDVTGIDLSPRAARLAQDHLKTLDFSGVAQVANSENLPFEDGSFDEVYSSGVYQHTPDPQRAINESIRVLRPGGQMTVILYHRRSWFWVLSRVGKANVEFQEEEAPIVEAYTRSELRHMFGSLRDLTIRMEHFRPRRTPRQGIVAGAYNWACVPLAACIPAPLIRPFGFHAVIRGAKT